MDQNWALTFDVTMVTKAFQEKFNRSISQHYINRRNQQIMQIHTYFFATGITKSTLKLSKKRTNKFDFAVLACASVNIFLSSLTLLFSQTLNLWTHSRYINAKNIPADHGSGRCRGNDDELIKSNCLKGPVFLWERNFHL